MPSDDHLNDPFALMRERDQLLVLLGHCADHMAFDRSDSAQCLLALIDSHLGDRNDPNGRFQQTAERIGMLRQVCRYCQQPKSGAWHAVRSMHARCWVKWEEERKNAD